MNFNIKKIGCICAKHRILKDLTLKELSELSGINQKSLSAFEKGRANNIKYILAYARYTNKDEVFEDIFYEVL